MWGEENGKGKKEMGNLLGNPILLYNYKVPQIRRPYIRDRSRAFQMVSLSAVWLIQISPISFSKVKLTVPEVFFLSCCINA